MNIKWYINSDGIKVKKCAICEKEFPYSVEGFRVMNSSGKIGAYCYKCDAEYHKKLQIKNKKTTRVNLRYFPFEVSGTIYKKCNVCKKELPYTLEYFDGNSKRLKPYCRKCRLDENRLFAEKRWAWNLFNNARASTNRYNLESITIDEDYLLELFQYQKGKCYWLGVDMKPSRETKHPFQPSIDRLDRNRGYIRGNVVLCCFVANFGRNENTEESWKQFLKNLKQNLNYSQWE